MRNTNDDVPRCRDAVERGVSSAELMPLASAARVIEEKVYAYDPRSIPERTAGIAHALAALIPLFVYKVDGVNVRRLTDAELKGGLFRHGGEDLHFLDGRAPITHIAVQRSRMAEVIAMLRRCQRSEIACSSDQRLS